MRCVDQRPTQSDPLVVSSSSTLPKKKRKIIIIVSVTFNELLFSCNAYLQSKRIFMNLIITSVNVETFHLSAFVIKQKIKMFLTRF